MLQLLSRPRQRGPLLDEAKQPLSPELQLATWRCLLSLKPKAELVELWLPRFDDFQRDNSGLNGVLEVAARMHLMAGSSEARAWSDRWVAAAGGDPAARICRMQVRLLSGEVPQAQDDAIVAVQAAIEPERALRNVLKLVDGYADRPDFSAADGARSMANTFRDLLQKGLPQFGGGR